jgi:nucleoid-associated protein YgaU
MRRPTSVLLISGALSALLAGGIVAALVVDPSSEDASASPVATEPAVPPPGELPFAEASSSGPPASVPPSTGAPAGVPAPVAASTPVPPTAAPTPEVLTYVVKPGDNLTVIAAWFKLNGYEGLYLANKDVIGANPNLIRPGQVFRIVDGRMQLG